MRLTEKVIKIFAKNRVNKSHYHRKNALESVLELDRFFGPCVKRNFTCLLSIELNKITNNQGSNRRKPESD